MACLACNAAAALGLPRETPRLVLAERDRLDRLIRVAEYNSVRRYSQVPADRDSSGETRPLAIRMQHLDQA